MSEKEKERDVNSQIINLNTTVYVPGKSCEGLLYQLNSESHPPLPYMLQTITTNNHQLHRLYAYFLRSS